MIAIETKYVPPTNTRPAKILAVTTTGRRAVEVSIDHGLDGPEQPRSCSGRPVRAHELEGRAHRGRHPGGLCVRVRERPAFQRRGLT
jgi:hypothetical protein